MSVPGRPAPLRRRLKGALLAVPSGRWLPGERGRRRVRLLAALMFRDEARFLPGLLRNLAPHVDGLVALDDGSGDGGDRLVADSPLTLELMSNPPGRPAWDEPGGFRRLVEAARRHGAEWIITVDADERLELDFRARAERAIGRGALLGLQAYQVRVRELWDTAGRFRCDGIWGLKWSARLFRARPGMRLDERPLHAAKAPLPRGLLRSYPLADLILYHLRMVHPEDRAARRRRYEALDPEAGGQPGLGYGYLTDERGLLLRTVPAARGFRE